LIWKEGRALLEGLWRCEQALWGGEGYREWERDVGSVNIMRGGGGREREREGRRGRTGVGML
jgi:hypothetical protein